MGLYIQVCDSLMMQRREQELLLLMAIARHADRLGFCFPGRARLMQMRHCSQPVYERRLSFLVDFGYLRVDETWDYRRRQTQFDFQISPMVIYVREEFQEYCQAVFDGIQERDFSTEKALLENHFSTNDSQPEVVNRIRNQSQKPASATSRKTSDHNQRSNNATKQQGRNASTMRSDRKQPTAAQPTAANAKRTEEKTDHAGGPDPIDLDTFTNDPELLVKAIMHVASTTQHQAAAAVQEHSPDQILHWLKNTQLRRSRGELKKPGGYFFKMLKSFSAPLNPAMPNGETYQEWENNESDLSEMEI